MAKKKTARKQDDAARRSNNQDRATLKLIKEAAQEVQGRILKKRAPEMRFPIRSLSNVTYRPRKGYFEIGSGVKTRTLSVSTVKTFAQTLRMMALSKDLIETSDFATKRDAYYQSKNWEAARFDEQTESDSVMDDIEAMFSVKNISREQLRFVPDEHGGAVAGSLVVLDPDPETGVVERMPIQTI